MGTSKKTNKILFFLGNTVLQGLLLAAVAKHSGFAWWMLLPLAVCALLGYSLTVRKSPEDAPACRHLVTGLFLDGCLLLALRGRVLLQLRGDAFTPQGMAAYDPTLRSVSWIVLAASVVLFLLCAFLCRRAKWVPRLLGVLGMVSVLARWCTRLSWTPRFASGGEEAAVAVLLLTAFCLLACPAVLAAAPEKCGDLNLQISFLYLAVILLNQLAPLYLYSCVAPAVRTLCAFLAGRTVVIPLVGMLCLCAAMYRKTGEDRFEPDYLVSVSFLGQLLALMAVLRWGSGSLPAWLLFLGTAAGSGACLRNGIAGKKTLRLNASLYLQVQIAAFFLLLCAVVYGLWYPLAVTAAFAILFYAQFDRMRKNPQGNFLWLSLLGFLAAEALSVRFLRGITAAHGAMLAAITLAAALCLLLLNWPHPSERFSAPSGLRAAVCGGAAVLLLLVTLA